MGIRRKLRFQIENRSYYLHRPKGCTVILIEREDWPGNEFGLWLPEAAISWINTQGEGSFQKWNALSQDEARWRFTIEGATLLTKLLMDHSNGCVWYSHAITNNSEDTLREVKTQTCFHLVNAPEFISIKGERLWACLDGEWRTTYMVPREQSLDPNRVKFLRMGMRKERNVVHIQGFPHSIMPGAACHPLIVAESFDGCKSVGVACRDMAFLFNNNDYILRCIHSEPFPIAAIPFGETAVHEGVILFCDGDHEALMELYNRIVPKDWWDAERMERQGSP